MWLGRPHPMLGKHHTDETRKKLSKSHDGIEPWNKGKHGLQEAWNKGIKQWEGRTHPSLGRMHSEESKRLMSEHRKGKSAWNKGKTKESSWQVQQLSQPTQLQATA